MRQSLCLDFTLTFRAQLENLAPSLKFYVTLMKRTKPNPATFKQVFLVAQLLMEAFDILETWFGSIFGRNVVLTYRVKNGKIVFKSRLGHLTNEKELLLSMSEVSFLPIIMTEFSSLSEIDYFLCMLKSTMVSWFSMYSVRFMLSRNSHKHNLHEDFHHEFFSFLILKLVIATTLFY